MFILRSINSTWENFLSSPFYLALNKVLLYFFVVVENYKLSYIIGLLEQEIKEEYFVFFFFKSTTLLISFDILLLIIKVKLNQDIYENKEMFYFKVVFFTVIKWMYLI